MIWGYNKKIPQFSKKEKDREIRFPDPFLS